MNNVSDNTISAILSIVLIGMIVILVFLCIWYIILKVKINRDKNRQTTAGKIELSSDKSKTQKGKKKSTVGNNYNIQPMSDFMEFEKVEDNMIVQKKRKKILNGYTMSRS